MTISQICICLAIAVYLIAMLGVGVWFSKRNNSVDDFYLGGRKLGPFVTAMSAEASDMSSWLLMGLPGVAYLSGLAEASWTAIGLAVGTYLNWLIVARRIRRYSHQIDAITVPQFFSKRWGDERNLLSAIAAVVIMIFSCPIWPPASPPAESCSPPCSASTMFPPCSSAPLSSSSTRSWAGSWRPALPTWSSPLS